SIGTSTNAKRAALIHLMFNFFGSIIFAIFLLAWPSFTADVLAKGFPTKPGTQIAMFHTLFNVVCVVLFLPLAQVFVRISKFIIRDKIDPDRKVIRLEERFLKTPRIALDHLQKEIAIMAHLATDVLEHAYQAFLKQEVSEKERIIEEIDYINNANKQLTNYLVKITSNDLTKKEQDVSSNLYYVISDLGRVADLAHNFTKYTDSYVYEKLVFTDEAFSRLDLMFLRVKQLANEMIMIFNDDEEASIELVDKLEAEIDSLREQLIDEHIERLNCGKCQANSSPVWINLVSNLERAADHMAMASHLVIEGGNKQ
ncbi:MAG TPA: PhoU domain-containing protein, partial [Bacilli bacterium]|nr:PhoU domain-containing protein [Bacilli bacterium]